VEGLRAAGRAARAAWAVLTDPYVTVGGIALALGLYLVGGHPWDGWE